ncbi:hypothetical protein PRZ48_003892 [Zasmidium cellare]|uniref:DAPG hydrolase PhiG domain-containing protein n=1 Tax=Zasmidium cellare TaxID=395010 RepID=A0ABR0EWP8_ZASCE|nr:hypothetical protein PRZ48_003892 [Zasmidium cellare]
MEPLETVTPAKNSTDFLDLSPDPSSYFLGYRQDDFAKPYAKYDKGYAYLPHGSINEPQDRYINTSSYVDEYVGSNAAKLSIGFIEPESVGFDQSRWPELNIETIVVGQVLIGNYTEASWDGKSYLMHQVRRMPNGYRELRSRSWIAKSNHGSAQLGHDLAVHCNIEMTHLGTFLPEIFQEFRDTC